MISPAEKPVLIQTDKWEAEWFRSGGRVVFYRRIGRLGVLVRGASIFTLRTTDFDYHPAALTSLVEAVRGLNKK